MTRQQISCTLHTQEAFNAHQPAQVSVREAIETRYSVHKFSSRGISEDDLLEILRLVSLSPSVWNLQPWRFVVVKSPELKCHLHEAAFHQVQITSAPVVIVLYSDMKDALEHVDEVVPSELPAERHEGYKRSIFQTFASMSETELESWRAGQSYIALGYLTLAARALGYDTSPMMSFEADTVKKILNLPRHVAIPAMVAIGEADATRYPRHRHPLERILTLR